MSDQADRPRVLVPDGLSEAGVSLLSDAGVDVDLQKGMDAAKLLEVIGDYDGLIVRSASKVTKDVLEAGTRLKVVGRAGIGVDNVDVEAATRRGIVVLNTPQGNIVSTAEHAIALMLAVARRVPQAHASLSAGKWEKSAFQGIELHGKTLGIVGFGRIGTLVAQRAHALGMDLIAADRFVSPQRFARAGVEQVELDELLARADFISLHVVLTEETRHMIDAAALARTKPGVVIVNASRGGVIDEEALAAAITDGHVGGAGLDVFENEPLADSPLFGLPNVVLTPHIAASTSDAQDKAGVIAAEQVLLALRGEFVPNAVNLEAGGELPAFVRSFMGLASTLGRLLGALATDNVADIEVSFEGQIADEDTRVLTLSALRGFLQPGVQEAVTYVNAPILAADRGIGYGERKTNTADDYVNLLRVTAQRESGPVTVAGTLAGRGNVPRLVEVDGRKLEIECSRYMAFFRHKDRPGALLSILEPLKEAGINIGNVFLGRPPEGEDEAINVMTVDSPIPPDVLDAIQRVNGISAARFVDLS